MHVLIISLSTRHHRRVLEDVEAIQSAGGDATVIALRADEWDLPDSVALHTLHEAEQRQILLRAERGLLFRLPKLVFRVARRLVRALNHRAPLPAAGHRSLDRSEELLTRAFEAQRRGIRTFHKRIFMRFYSYFRPLALWRLTKAQLLPKLDVAAFDQIVVADSMSVPVGWHLARRNPNVPVGFELDLGPAEQPAA